VTRIDWSWIVLRTSACPPIAPHIRSASTDGSGHHPLVLSNQPLSLETVTFNVDKLHLFDGAFQRGMRNALSATPGLLL